MQTLTDCLLIRACADSTQKLNTVKIEFFSIGIIGTKKNS